MQAHPTTFAATLLGCLMLSACGGGGSDGTSSGSGSTSASGGTSSTCQYSNLISDTERKQASACGIQVSGNYAQADSGYDSLVAACKQGDKAKADAYYSGTYQKMVDYARSVSKDLGCGQNNGPTLPNNTTASNYNFCVKSTSVNGKLSYEGACYGPVKSGEGGCGSGYSYISQYASLSTCTSGGKSWLESR
ncbi:MULTISPECIES: hypothetical protein [Janthinobacterium]|uniref:hypothetical protein n=1 Tax=Janthinobacterium TaxID=29580 RepID=UPI001C5A5DB9|nr:MULTISPECIES: hypothetical protein [Janthinobacterium]MBW3507361.1 hypothetical protein [Janthinobacterium sp. NKUCC06_STL]MCA1860234.1 hypothetical protein [Janthinobacterium lividum]